MNELKKCKLSIVVPVYNVKDYLVRCIDSILAQTYPVHEIILVNDGSTDGSLAILEEYRQRYSNIIVVNKENGGLVSARKAGLEFATGDYIACVDSDDFIEPNMYEEMMKLMVTYEVDIVTSGLIRDYGKYFVYEPENIPPGIYKEKDTDYVVNNLVEQEKFYRVNISSHITNKIFKASLLRKYQNSVDNKIKMGEDLAVTYPYMYNARSIYISGKNYYHYCVRENSVVANKDADDYESLELLYGHVKRAINSVKDRELNILLRQLERIWKYTLLIRDCSKVITYSDGILWPYGEINITDRVLIYGAGKYGVGLRDLLMQKGINVVAWVDKSSKRKNVKQNIQEVKVEYDIVIIAVLIAEVVEDIQNELEKSGVSSDKILSLLREF